MLPSPPIQSLLQATPKGLQLFSRSSAQLWRQSPCMETTPRIARLDQRICLDGWKMEQEGTGQLIEWAFQNKPKDQVWLLDQLFPSRSHLQKWKADVRRWQCQVDKAQASHQLHPEQLCKFSLSIPSKNVVEHQRGSLNHRMTYGPPMHWRQGVESRKWQIR